MTKRLERFRAVASRPTTATLKSRDGKEEWSTTPIDDDMMMMIFIYFRVIIKAKHKKRKEKIKINK